MEKLHKCLRNETDKAKETEALLQIEREKVKSLSTELSIAKKKLASSCQSIQNEQKREKDQHNLAHSSSSDINMKNKITDLKNELKASKAEAELQVLFYIPSHCLLTHDYIYGITRSDGK